MDKIYIRKIALYILITSIIIRIISTSGIEDIYLKKFVIPTLLIIGVFTFLLKIGKQDIRKKGYFFLIPIALILASNILINIAEVNKNLNIIMILSLSTIYFMYLTNEKYKLFDRIIVWFTRVIFKGVFKNTKELTGVIPKKTVNIKKIFKIMVGIVISIPITFALINLLAMADEYFHQLLLKISQIGIFSSNLSDIFKEITIVILLAFIGIMIFINIIKTKDKELEEKKNKEMDITIWKTILIIVNAIFLLFIISEISKVTGNFLQLPVEYTYAQYAREGFFELLLISFINFGIISFGMNRENSRKEKIIKALHTVIACFSLFLIFNSSYRLFLYINAYGFTILRLQVAFFLVLMLIYFITITYKIIKEKIEGNKIYWISAIIIYIMNLYFCAEWFIKWIS